MDKLLENLIAPSVLGIIIQTIGAIIVAFLTKQVFTKKPHNYSGWAIMGAAAVVTFVAIGLIFTWLTPEPRLRIYSPNQGQSIDVQIASTGEGHFSVTGGSEGIHTNEDLRVYILVHPSQTTTWHIQPPIATNPNGDWSGTAQIGNKAFPPKAGNSFEILAVAAKPNEIRKNMGADNAISDPKDLKPAAQSNLVSINIGATIEPPK